MNLHASSLLALCLTSGPPGAAPQPRPPEIQVVQHLSFGGLLMGNAGGSIAMTPEGALIPLGSGIQPGAQPPSSEAWFRLSGPPRARFTLKVDPQTPMLTNPAGGSIRVAEFLPSLPGLQGSFDALGQAEFKLGARIDLGAGALAGLYLAPQVKLQLFVQGASGTGTATQPFRVSALIREPLLLANTGPLDFGVLLPGHRPGPFTVLAEGGHRAGSAGSPMLIQGNPRPASFSIQGSGGRTYCIQLPRTIRLSGPGAGMEVMDFTCSIPKSGLVPAGGMGFGVGASVMVQPDQVPGTYRGTFAVTVHYQ